MLFTGPPNSQRTAVPTEVGRRTHACTIFFLSQVSANEYRFLTRVQQCGVHRYDDRFIKTESFRTRWHADWLERTYKPLQSRTTFLVAFRRGLVRDTIN